MTYTPPSTAARTNAPSKQVAADRHFEPPRKQAENKSARDRFASKLDREGQGDGAQRKGAMIGAEQNSVSGQFANNRGFDSDGSTSGFEGFAQQSHSVNGLGATNAGSPSQLGGTTIDLSTLQRMAAQIAESWPSRSGETLSVQFADRALAQSALISREPDGSIAIRIAGLDPNLTARQNARAQLELANALAQRRLRVTSLKFEAARTDQRALPSDMPRAV